MTKSTFAAKELSNLAKILNPVALDCGATFVKDKKYLLSYRLGNGMYVHIRANQSSPEEIVVYLYPEIGMDKIETLPGIEKKEIEGEKHCSGMTGFPEK